jgi:phosphoribosylformylglycinamidine cyclo-ligase
MNRVFNCGIGMVVVVPAVVAEEALSALKAAGESAYRIGFVRDRAEGEAQTIVKAKS